ncbi:MAG: pyridoxal phosphate-dependent aminotransferase [Flavobacteriales bacterium Tduv]
MPKLSEKGISTPLSPIRKLTPLADQTRKKGVKIYHLNIGQPDIATPDIALEAVRNAHIKTLSYSPSEGFESYREKLVEYYAQQNISLSKGELLVTTGGSEAISFILASITDPGDEIISPEPLYANYKGIAIFHGVKIVPITSKIEENFSLPPIEAFEKKITPYTKAVLICNPNNPTGYLYTEKELLQLKDLVIKHNIFLIADEVYREFAYDNLKHFSILQSDGLEEHAVIIDSVSKRYSMCGARIGCIASKNQELISCTLKFAQTRLSPPSLAQIAAEAAVDTPKTYFEEVIFEYTLRRNTLLESLSQIKGVRYNHPQGAFYCMAEFPVDDAESFARWLLQDFHYKKQTVMISPANGFYVTPNLGKRQVRLAYVLNESDLKKAIEVLQEALKHYPGKSDPL